VTPVKAEILQRWGGGKVVRVFVRE
jgi:hypothetical protein